MSKSTLTALFTISLCFSAQAMGNGDSTCEPSIDANPNMIIPV